jgi:hypothetical protein
VLQLEPIYNLRIMGKSALIDGKPFVKPNELKKFLAVITD